jgi:putative oxidoreductase
MKIFDRITSTENRATTVLIRILVGSIFLSEGIQKFLYPDKVGAGRFEKIGFQNPELLANFVGASEIAFGCFLLLGFLTRLSVLPIVIIMLTAITTTKIPILIESGFWKMAHDARTDFSMLTCSIFLLIEGGGRWSVDRALRRHFRYE